MASAIGSRSVCTSGRAGEQLEARKPQPSFTACSRRRPLPLLSGIRCRCKAVLLGQGHLARF